MIDRLVGEVFRRADLTSVTCKYLRDFCTFLLLMFALLGPDGGGAESAISCKVFKCF